MNYQVTWSNTAEQNLAAIWLLAPDRAAMTAAAEEVDRLLSVDAHDRGESRDGQDRIMFEHPLAVRVEVDPLRFLVRVLRVWTY